MLGQTEASHLLTTGQGRQPMFLLLLSTKGVDGIHHQRVLHRNKRAQTAVSSLKFLADQAIIHIAHSRAVIPFYFDSQQSQFSQLGNQVLVKDPLFKIALHIGHVLVFYPFPNRVPNSTLIAGQKIVCAVIVNSLKRFHGWLQLTVKEQFISCYIMTRDLEIPGLITKTPIHLTPHRDAVR